MFFMLHDASLHKQWHSQRTGARKSGLNVPVGLMVKDRKMLEHFDSTWMATYRKHANRPKGYDIDHVIPKAHFYFSNKAIIDFVNGPKNTSLLKSADNKLKSNRIENPTTGKPYYPRVPKAVLNSFHYDALLKHYKYEKATGHKFMGSTSITQAMLDDAQKNRNKKTYLAKVRSRKLQGL